MGIVGLHLWARKRRWPKLVKVTRLCAPVRTARSQQRSRKCPRSGSVALPGTIIWMVVTVVVESKIQIATMPGRMFLAARMGRHVMTRACARAMRGQRETLKGEKLAAGGYGETAFGVDNFASKGCPTRLFKKMGRYSLKQLLKKNDAGGDVLNIFKHMTRRADRLGLYDAKTDFV